MWNWSAYRLAYNALETVNRCANKNMGDRQHPRNPCYSKDLDDAHLWKSIFSLTSTPPKSEVGRK